MINNAGVEPHASILDLDEWDWRRTIDVNLTGPFFTHAVGGARDARAGGRRGRQHRLHRRARRHGLRDRSAYVASKMGLIGLTREAAREFAAYNIRVNAVCPGVIETEMTAALRQNEAMMRKWLEDIPQGRLGRRGRCGLVGAVPVQRWSRLPDRAGDQRGRRQGDVLTR